MPARIALDIGINPESLDKVLYYIKPCEVASCVKCSPSMLVQYGITQGSGTMLFINCSDHGH